MGFKDDSRARDTIENMKDMIEAIEESMDSNDDCSYLVKKLANKANELVKICN